MKKHALNNQDWYIAHTSPNMEKRVDLRIREMGCESYLPLYVVTRQWSDRKKKVAVPVFPNYVFVRTELKQMGKLLDIRGLMSFVSFGGAPAKVRNKEVESVKKVLVSEEVEVLNEPTFRTGERVSITSGQFSGVEGVLVRQEGKNRLVIEFEALQQSVCIDIAMEYVEKIYP